MTPEAQRIAIAEGAEWRSYTGERPHEVELKYLPDYLNDLNVMHEAEKVLMNRDLWMFNLAEVVGIDVHSNGRTSLTNCFQECDKIQFATATQRAEAFLRTLGLWK